MKILAVILILLVVVAVSVVLYLKYRLDNTTDTKNLEATLDSEVAKFTKAKLSYGLAIGVYKNGKSFIKGYGTVNRESATVPDASTVFQIASVSKLFTASLLQTLCDEDVLKIDATLGELIGDTVTL
jgi:CubicO group peptidase (beta-lactamase class C family)